MYDREILADAQMYDREILADVPTHDRTASAAVQTIRMQCGSENRITGTDKLQYRGSKRRHENADSMERIQGYTLAG